MSPVRYTLGLKALLDLEKESGVLAETFLRRGTHEAGGERKGHLPSPWSSLMGLWNHPRRKLSLSSLFPSKAKSI